MSALYLIYRIVLDCCRPRGLRAALVDPTGKNLDSKRLTPMNQVLPKLTLLWKLLTVVEVLASLLLVATAFYQTITFESYITDHVRQPYEGTSTQSNRLPLFRGVDCMTCVCSSSAGSYWKKLGVPPINWEYGAKWILQK